MTVVRTVLGDIDPSAMGVTYAHEHLVIDGGRPVQMAPDFDLSDVDRMATELAAAADLGLGTVVDAMPCDAGRSAAKLAELSRRTGVHVIAPTGLHHDRYYGPAHWRHRLSVDELADLFVADIDEGIDANDYATPIVRRTTHRAGVIKVAGSTDGPSDVDRPTFEAAAQAHRPDRRPDPHPLRGRDRRARAGPRCWSTTASTRPTSRSATSTRSSTAATTASWPRPARSPSTTARSAGAMAPNGTLQALTWAAEDERLDRVVLGMDAARQGYYAVYGGRPGSDLAARTGSARCSMQRDSMRRSAIACS